MPNPYEDIARRFRDLCEFYALPVPRICPSLPTDPCDFTCPEEVRLNVQAAGDIDPDYHARHVFGHYISGLHEWEPNGNQDWADPVADLVADLIRDSMRVATPGAQTYKSIT